MAKTLTQHLFIYQTRTVRNARYKIARGEAPTIEQRHPIATVAIEVTARAGEPITLKGAATSCHPADQFIRSEGAKKAIGRLKSRKLNLILDLNDAKEFTDGENATYLVPDRLSAHLTTSEMLAAIAAINSVATKLIADSQK